MKEAKANKSQETKRYIPEHTTYGMLVVKPGGLNPFEPDSKRSDFIGRLFSVFSKSKSASTLEEKLKADEAVYDLSEQLFIGQIDEGDIAMFKSFADQPLVLSRIVARLGDKCTKTKFEQERAEKSKLKDKEGLILSDLIEVLPEDVGAKILLATADPDNSTEMKRFYPGVDIQQTAVAVTCLLPKTTRAAMFRVMSTMSPGTSGRAYRLFSFLASNWVNRMSDYNGQKLIEAHLSEDEARAKIDEISNEFLELGSQLRNGM